MVTFQDLDRDCDEHYKLMSPAIEASKQALVDNTQLETVSSDFVTRFKAFIGLE